MVIARWRRPLIFNICEVLKAWRYCAVYACLNEWPEWFVADENRLYPLPHQIFFFNRMKKYLKYSIAFDYIVSSLDNSFSIFHLATEHSDSKFRGTIWFSRLGGARSSVHAKTIRPLLDFTISGRDAGRINSLF